MLLLLVGLVSVCLGSPFVLESLDALLLPKMRSDDPGLDQTFFPNLINIEINSNRASQSDYPWIAKVVHSNRNNYPHVCTASCINARVFISSGSCVYNLKVKYTTVIYQQTKLPALALVLSNVTTKQMFDDIGFIIVNDEDYQGKWPTVELVSEPRSGDGFQWFADWNTHGPTDYTAVGYATDKSLKEKAAMVEYYLSSLDVVIDINLCYTILSVNGIRGFYVPCYHSCSLQEFNQKDPKCQKFLGVEGGVVIDKKANKLLGVSTWSASSRRTILPVGFSVPNSEEFYKNYECAMSIANDETALIATRNLQELCHN